MAKLLYITCDLRANEQSCGLRAGSAFLEEYLKWNPRDEIHMLDLYRDPVPSADRDVLSALEKTARGHHFATLTTAEQRKLSRVWDLAGQFAAVEKYVLVTPMWKPGFPSELWQYLDAVLVAGKTYRDTPSGPEGLLHNQRRKCLLIHASEGFVYGKRELPCVSHLKDTMKFLGVEQFQSIAIGGVNPPLAEKEGWPGEGVGRVMEAALTF